jgi:septal ring factor EnvC (AmiA/AmiB activator)
MSEAQIDRLDHIEEILAKMSALLAAEQCSRLELRADLKTLTDAVKRNSEAISQITQRLDHVLHVYRV